METFPSLDLPTQQPSQQQVNILLVDDQPANLLALEALLKDLGHNLVKALSGEEALGRCLQDDFAVVLLDVHMPGLDGFETAKLIRGRNRSQRTPIIFLTAFENTRLTIEEAYALGAVDYLVKPLVPLILRAKVAGFVELFEKAEQIKHQEEQIRQLQRLEFERQLAAENARYRESEQRFTRFMQHLPGLAWIKDLQGRYVYANEAALRVFRMSRTVLYGKTDDDIFSPATAGQFKSNDQRALASETGVQAIEILQHEDGAAHHSIVSKFPLMGHDGKAALLGGMAIDITDRLRAEEALKESHRRKDEFLAMLAHELRNPLAPIRYGLELMRLAQDNTKVVTQVRGTMERQLQQMVRLIDDLLDVSRISTGKIELRKERIELATVLENAVETCRPAMEAAGHQLTVTLPPEPVLLDADPIRLAQVFANLLNNAAKYTERGGRVWLTAERQAGDVVLRVRDTGIGIPADKLAHIFEMFVQVDHSLERSDGGLGIGLTLVQRLVALHGGSVEAKSDGPGRGSEFVVYLPVVQLPPNAQGQQSHGEANQAVAESGCRVLVVDDNEDSAKVLGMMLECVGHEIRLAHDGLAAVEMAEAFRPDVAFLDIGMPGLNGYDAAQRIREQPWSKNMVLVALTGCGQEEDRHRAREAGFDHYLVKPVKLEALQKVISRSFSGESDLR